MKAELVLILGEAISTPEASEILARRLLDVPEKERDNLIHELAFVTGITRSRWLAAMKNLKTKK